MNFVWFLEFRAKFCLSHMSHTHTLMMEDFSKNKLDASESSSLSPWKPISWLALKLTTSWTSQKRNLNLQEPILLFLLTSKGKINRIYIYISDSEGRYGKLNSEVIKVNIFLWAMTVSCSLLPLTNNLPHSMMPLQHFFTLQNSDCSSFWEKAFLETCTNTSSTKIIPNTGQRRPYRTGQIAKNQQY